jgi:hypothetical protein
MRRFFPFLTGKPDARIRPLSRAVSKEMLPGGFWGWGVGVSIAADASMI